MSILSPETLIGVLLLVLLVAGGAGLWRIRSWIEAALSRAHERGVTAGADAGYASAIASVVAAVTRAQDEAGQRALQALDRALLVRLQGEGAPFRRSVDILGATAGELQRQASVVAGQRERAAEETLAALRLADTLKNNLEQMLATAANILTGLRAMAKDQGPRVRQANDDEKRLATPAPPSAKPGILPPACPPPAEAPEREGPLAGVVVEGDDFVRTVEVRGGVVVPFGPAPDAADGAGAEGEDPYAADGETRVFVDPNRRKAALHAPSADRLPPPSKPAVPAGARS